MVENSLEIPEGWGGGLPLLPQNGKSEGVGGVLYEIPSVVGVWIFSGTTHGKISIKRNNRYCSCVL